MSVSKNSIRDAHLDYIIKRVYYPATAFVQGQITGSSTALTTDIAGSVNSIVSLSSSGAGAVKITATTENIDMFWRVPYDFDNNNRLFVRYYWTSDYATANGTATFKTLYLQHAANAVLAVGSVALTKAIAASTKVSATARIPYWTPWGYIAPIATGAGANSTFLPTTQFVMLRTSVSAVGGLTIGSDFIYMIGMELAYTPHMTYGSGSEREARMLEDNLLGQAAGPASANSV